LKIIVSTLRQVHTASRHDLSAVSYMPDKVFKARDFLGLEVFDRVGSGDAFAAGFIYALLNEKDLQYAVDCGTAHAVLAMTTPGDNSMTNLNEIESLMSGAGASVKR
jgi:2-dehydro-3-deoxygluconokinase